MKAVTFGGDYKKGDSIWDYVKANSVTMDPPGSDTWFIGSREELLLKRKIEDAGTPLKDWNVGIHYGIKTGYNRAFVIDGAKRDELVAADPKSADIIRPMLKGRDIGRYSADFQGTYLIVCKYGSHRYLKSKYPEIHKKSTGKICGEIITFCNF